MTKKLINIFVLLVFAIQIVPVKQVGGLLFGNQITEDIIQDVDGVDDLAKDGCKIENKSEFITLQFAYNTHIFTSSLFTLKEVLIVFPHNHSTDIYSPPPNSVA
ncbi:MAG: hypothetical protein QM541_06315 [Flavobacterium sp.]|nr:hypothetical protein [Flavobacterium sp.]